MNDLSPAACHIALGYTHSVDQVELENALHSIRRTIVDELGQLYETEHYEPATGLYDPGNPEVARKLSNPVSKSTAELFPFTDHQDKPWELLPRSEVEARMGADVFKKVPLPSGIDSYISIPAVTQYAIWSDIYICYCTKTLIENTERIQKSSGKPITKSVRRPRGCGAQFTLWDAAVDPSDGSIMEEFACPHCGQVWKKVQLKRNGFVPVVTNYCYRGLKLRKKGKNKVVVEAVLRTERPTTNKELDRLPAFRDIAAQFNVLREFRLWTDGPQYRRNALAGRGITSVADFYTERNHAVLSSIYREIQASDPALVCPLLFSLTAIALSSCRMYKYKPDRKGGTLMGSLYFPSLFQEMNAINAFDGKIQEVLRLNERNQSFSSDHYPPIRLGSAGALKAIPDNSVDYVFTDPPFGSNIYYSEAEVLWDAWLGRRMDREKEAVAHRKADGGNKSLTDYREIMTSAFREVFRVLKPGRFATVEYNNKDGNINEAIKKAVRDSGFEIMNIVFLDKVHRTFKQLKGDSGEEDTAGHDVIFNLKKPAAVGMDRDDRQEDSGNDELEEEVYEAIREHLLTLPDRIRSKPELYDDFHRTTPFLNTMLISSLIPKGVSVERISIPLINRICAKRFKRIDNQWYLKEQSVSESRSDRLFEVEAEVSDEASALRWLSQRLRSAPCRIVELRPHWMKATVKLTGDLSTQLERLLRENFWLDRSTRRWRVPTVDELVELNDHERQRACHDAERFLEGKLSPPPTDADILGWIDRLYSAACRLEEEAHGLVEHGEEPGLPDEALNYYKIMPRLFQSVLKEKVDAPAYTRASRQCRTAARKVEEHEADPEDADRHDASGVRQGRLFD
jgi:hypothetical protein